MSGLWRLLAPRHRVHSVVALTPLQLRAWGIEALMLDLDNTLVPWGEAAPPPHVTAWLATLRQAGIPACLVSNNLSGRVRRAAGLLNLPVAAGRFKPSAAKLRRALAIMGTAPARTAMVGDQLFTDVLAGNRLGVPTILVAPLTPREPLRVRLVRAVERRVLAALAARGLVAVSPEG
ncbi:MAG: YqeG family HAD IIIA-type phosphatase [Armatimonadota bacterium]|nr:YqeG family HAD IIIA-type phosphatase [Armatimonadota bacterium]MDR7534641.1 YqeG family HAD IIIA-type phosphatase [Armatimonadota bacterium]MDR7537057.1 YqeG family HAD IIIA-type phosphatase [Armatimonadota bacterium]